MPDFSSQNAVFTFEGLIRKTPFVSCIGELLHLLQSKLGTPVDMEFAYDGNDFYLLQCRPQSYGADTVPVAIPQNLPSDKVIFSAAHFVSNGKVPEITHIVYVDLEGYSQSRIRQPCAMSVALLADSISYSPNASLFWSGPDGGAAAETSNSAFQ